MGRRVVGVIRGMSIIRVGGMVWRVFLRTRGIFLGNIAVVLS